MKKKVRKEEESMIHLSSSFLFFYFYFFQPRGEREKKQREEPVLVLVQLGCRSGEFGDWELGTEIGLGTPVLVGRMATGTPLSGGASVPK